MLRQRWSGIADISLKITIYTAVFVVGLVTFSQKTDPNRFSNWPLLIDVLNLVRSAWFLAPLFAGVGAAAKILSGYIGAPVLWNTVQYVLNQYQEELFGDQSKPHHHRVTLFKHTKLCWRLWPWHGWMVPVARSGHTTKSGVPVFKAHDEMPEKAEGIAGQAYVQKKPISIKDLPDINVDSPSDEDLDMYAKKGFISRKWLNKRLEKSKRKEKSNARSFLGIQIRVKGETWGVLVIDSQDPKGDFIEREQKSKRCKTLIEILGIVLANGKR